MHIFFTKQWANLFGDEQGCSVDTFEIAKKDKVISYSFLKKEINKLAFAKNVSERFFDITSSYGYGGIYVSESAQTDLSFIKEYKNKFVDYCIGNNIVTDFIRFHPLQKNHLYFDDIYGLKQVNDNAFIELGQSSENIEKNIAKRHRYCIRKAIASGVTVEFKDDFEAINDFMKLYKETNDKNHASSFYYFSNNFFKKLHNMLGDKIKLVIAYLKGEPISAALFVCDEGEVYYFLSGTSKLGYSVFACHLLLHEVIFWAKNNGYALFNLGGGVKRNDNLFLFKSGFSNTIAPYFVGTATRMEKIYDKFLKMSSVSPEVDYFPKYRYDP